MLISILSHAIDGRTLFLVSGLGIKKWPYSFWHNSYRELINAILRQLELDIATKNLRKDSNSFRQSISSQSLLSI